MRKLLQTITEILELALAVFVLIAILISAAGLIFHGENYSLLLHDIDFFRVFLEEIFTLVIGIEFIQMLCKPNSDNVLEILIFLVARHMVIGETNPVQDFLSVISIALLVVLRRYLHNSRVAHEQHLDAAVQTGEKKSFLREKIEQFLY